MPPVLKVPALQSVHTEPLEVVLVPMGHEGQSMAPKKLEYLKEGQGAQEEPGDVQVLEKYPLAQGPH